MDIELSMVPALQPLFGTLNKLIELSGNREGAAVLREHVNLFKTQLETANDHIAKLETENAQLLEEIREVRKQFARKFPPDDYVEHRGAFFKREPGGGHGNTPMPDLFGRNERVQ